MAVVRGNTNQTGSNTDGSGNISFTLNVSAGSNKAVLVYVHANATTDPTTVTVGGSSASLVRKTSNGTLTVWTYQITGVGTGNKTVLVGWGSLQTNIYIGATDFSNVNQSSPIDADNGGSGTINSSGGTASVSTTANGDNGYLVGTMSFQNNEAGGPFMSPNGGETELYETIAGGGPGVQVEAEANTSAGSVSVSWANSSSLFNKSYAAQIIVLKIDTVTNTDNNSAKANIKATTTQNNSVKAYIPTTRQANSVKQNIKTTYYTGDTYDWNPSTNINPEGQNRGFNS